ncbi:hypothetical protein [Streptomyces acidiscabies]|uniref:Uncharacterized protein n=1 Tax=Streptomyces acidiscabies TaxID=42234 RepID=A0ABU4M7V0_9ACTN|nr:hypothetical protein [Streptomyces acidiscabies]MDX3024040.1 hypothetical protein [Streptomyces acidiscabies]
MSENSVVPVVRGLEVLESSAFRLGQVMRRVLADHPDLPMRWFSPRVYSTVYADGDVSTAVGADINAGSVDGVRTWAQALGATASVETKLPGQKDPYESARFAVVLDGVTVEVSGTRLLSSEERAALEAEQGGARGGE